MASTEHSFWLGGDVLKDLRVRWKLYGSDWRDAWPYGLRIIAPSLYIFFASVLPALAFGEQLARETHRQLTVVHVLSATAIAGVTQALVGGQPLLILGVAEPIVIIYSYMYQFAEETEELGAELFLPWAAWTCVWTAVMVAIVAVSGACRGITYFTRMCGELFGMLIAVLFMQQAVEGLISEFREDELQGSGEVAAPWLMVNGLWAIILFFGLLSTCLLVINARSWRFGVGWLRGLVADYGVPGLVVAFSGLSFALKSEGNASGVPDSIPRRIVTPHTWEVKDTWSVAARMGEVPGRFIAGAIIPAIPITVLFWFDHGVSAQMAQPKALNLKKPPAYAWDMLLLSVLTLVMGLLGLPPVNGVLPQAPMHTRALAGMWKQTHAKPIAESNVVDSNDEDNKPRLQGSRQAVGSVERVGSTQLAVQMPAVGREGVLQDGHVEGSGALITRCHAHGEGVANGVHVAGNGVAMQQGTGEAAVHQHGQDTGSAPAHAPGKGSSMSQGPAVAEEDAPGLFFRTYETPAEEHSFVPPPVDEGPGRFFQTYSSETERAQGAGQSASGHLTPPASSAEQAARAYLQSEPVQDQDGHKTALQMAALPPTNRQKPPSHVTIQTAVNEDGCVEGFKAYEDLHEEGAQQVGVAEQRVSNLLQSLFVAVCLGLTYAIKQIPTSVIWGYFAFMSLDSLPGSQFTSRLLYVFTDPKRRVPAAFVEGVPYPVVVAFTALQFAWLAGVWVLTKFAGIGGVAFPVAIVLLVPLRLFVLPRVFNRTHLHKLDTHEVI